MVVALVLVRPALAAVHQVGFEDITGAPLQDSAAGVPVEATYQALGIVFTGAYAYTYIATDGTPWVDGSVGIEGCTPEACSDKSAWCFPPR